MGCKSTNCSCRQICQRGWLRVESDFEVAVDRYSSLHIIVVTLETLELLLCLESSSVSLHLSFSPQSMSLSFSISSFSRMHRYCFLMRHVISLGEGFDLALATRILCQKRPSQIPISCLVCADRRSTIFYIHVNVGNRPTDDVKEHLVIRHGNIRRKLRGKTANWSSTALRNIAGNVLRWISIKRTGLPLHTESAYLR